ncbi:MAG TPA: LuxR C-terminal-related transcriptional regulator [Ktedonobacteraceae bacterium]
MQDNIYILPAREPGEPKKTPTHHLPTQLTPLIGRQQEVAAACRLLRRSQVRLLTLAGTGGVGKTRLALQVATTLMEDFADGVASVPLAPISDPELVLPTIAQALGIKEGGAGSFFALLQAALLDKQLLLLLDNFEQILPAAPQLMELLSACPGLKLLVTSRAVLHVQGEQEFPVPPLALPNLTRLPEPEVLVDYASVALFLQRAQAVMPTFQLTAANTRAIAEMCVRLDGLPLAIELAAARIKLLPPQALLARLGRRLELLTSRAQDVPTRQQTLRNTIAWSYQLLDPSEQRLFRRLAVFVGGCTLEAVEAVCGERDDEAGQVLDGVASLLDKSLLQQVGQEGEQARLVLLETIREYGLECLERCGELEATRTVHAHYYLALAEEAASHLSGAVWPSHFHALMPHLAEEATPRWRGAEQVRWVEPLEREQENLRAALSFLLEQAHVQAGRQEGERQVELALRLCVALSWFWHVRGYGREGLSYLMQALDERTGGGAALRARALYEAAELAFIYERNQPLERLTEESLALYEELGDTVGMAHSLSRLGGIARIRSRFALAHARLEEAATRFQALGNRWRQGQCFTEWARAATEEGQYEQAHTLLSESLLFYQELGDTQRLSWVRYLLAHLLFVSQQDQALAQQLAEQSLAHFRERGDTPFSVYPLGLLGLIHLEQGKLEAARPLLEESLAIGKQTGVETDAVHLALGLARLLTLQGDAASARRLYQESLTLLLECNVYKESVAASLEGLAALEAGQGGPRQAVRLWGAAEALREAIGAPMHPVHRASYEQALALVHTELGERAFAAAWAEGRNMTPDQVLATPAPASAPAQVPPRSLLSAPPNKPVTYPYGLTAREMEILRLLAQGWTDAQIAEHLVISPRTVNHHTTSLYNKLGVSSRAVATRYAIEHHLL